MLRHSLGLAGLALAFGLTSAGCGTDKDGTSTTTGAATGSGTGSGTGAGTGSGTGGGTGTGTGSTSTAPAPVQTDCASLPAAIEGDDPLSQRFRFKIVMAGDCSYSDSYAPPDSGGTLILEYYIDQSSGFENNQASFEQSFSGNGDWVFASCSAGNVMTDFRGDDFGCSGLTTGDEITFTLTSDDGTRTLEVVLVIQAPYAAILSITEV